MSEAVLTHCWDLDEAVAFTGQDEIHWEQHREGTRTPAWGRILTCFFYDVKLAPATTTLLLFQEKHQTLACTSP